MMKKIYISPEVEVMKIQSQGQMLTGSLTGIGGDSGMGYGGGSDSEIARTAGNIENMFRSCCYNTTHSLPTPSFIDIER